MNLYRLKERLQTSLRRDPDSACWNWTGQISNTGHGRIAIRIGQRENRIVSAEFASYTAYVGTVPEGHLVRQTCGNRLCINPEHLELFDPSAT